MSKEMIVRATSEQLVAWAAAAGEAPLDEWLAELADDAATAEPEPSWPLTIKLKTPIKFGDDTITSIELQQGHLGLLKGLKLGGGDVSVENLLTVASRMSGQPPRVIERLAPGDAGEVMSRVMDFFAASLARSKRRSR